MGASHSQFDDVITDLKKYITLLDPDTPILPEIPLPVVKPPVLGGDLTRPGQSPMLQRRPREQLKAKIRESHRAIAGRIAAHDAQIIPRTQAHNRKSERQSLEAERAYRSDVLKGQIQTWRKLLPGLIRKFSKISDPRRPGSVIHKMTVVMMFGLFAFILKLESRREMNRELTGAVIHENLKKLFPDIDSIPHADCLARVLRETDPKAIERIHAGLIRDLVRSKKFRGMMIDGCLPVTVDGAQKLFRDGVLQDPRWCERMVGTEENRHKQQYVYVIEANITLKNGLSIPLMTEFLYRENNQLMQPEGKQDNEITAFERMAQRIKKYFPRQRLIFFMDAMYATFDIMDTLKKNGWEFIITLPRKKFIGYAKILGKERKYGIPAPGHKYWRGRRQEFYWQNNVSDDEARGLKIHLAGCLEEYEEVDKTTGDIKKCYSDRTWMSSIMVFSDKLHELFNEGARKKELIEDCINTEKNRGYHYRHAFSYDMNAMQGFHYLMRLGHAINALSEFTRELRKYIMCLGVNATLKLIKDSLCNPWFSREWYESVCTESPRLRFQLE